jgi:hypothetical protein
MFLHLLARKNELKSAIVHDSLFSCFTDERVAPDLGNFIERMTKWKNYVCASSDLLSPDVVLELKESSKNNEEDENIDDPKLQSDFGPTFETLALLYLELLKWDVNPVDSSDEEEDDNDYDIYGEADEDVISKNVDLLRKCVMRGIVRLLPKEPKEPKGQIGKSLQKGQSLREIDFNAFNLKSNVDDVIASVGWQFQDEESRTIFQSVWKHGKPAFKEVSVVESKEVLESLIKNVSDKLVFRMNRERDVKWTVTTDFFLRWQSSWSFECWNRCLQLSYFLALANPKYPTTIWNGVSLNILDGPMDEMERYSYKKRIENKDEASFELVMKDRCNWPLMFMNLLREFSYFGCSRWRWLLTGVSLFFNAIMTEMGHLVARQFICDIISSLMSYRRVFEVRSSPAVIDVLKSLLARTYFPSIFAGVLLDIVNISDSDDEAMNYEDEAMNDEEKENSRIFYGNDDENSTIGYETEITTACLAEEGKENRVKDIICDPLFSKGQLHPLIDLGMSEFF